MKNFELKAAARANLGFISSFAIVALTIGAVACGSEKQKVHSGDITTGNVVVGGNVLTPSNGNATASSNCNYSGASSYVGSQSPLTYTINGNASTLGTAFFITTNPNNPNATDLIKTYKLAAFDYDYCAFTADFGYGNGPLKGFHNATFYLVNGTPGAALAQGTYNVGATSGMYAVVDTTAGAAVTSVVQSSTGGTAGAKCSSTYQYPASGTITLDQAPAAATNGSHFISGITGNYTVTLSGSATLQGTFSSGACSASGTPDLTRAASCTCGL